VLRTPGKSFLFSLKLPKTAADLGRLFIYRFGSLKKSQKNFYSPCQECPPAPTKVHGTHLRDAAVHRTARDSALSAV
jgi:hypothetical protein